MSPDGSPEPDRSSESVWSRRLGLATAACVVTGMVREAIVTSGPNQDLAEILGFGLGWGFSSLLIAALLFGWTRRTRAAMPHAMWVLFILYVAGLILDPPKPRRLEVAAELQRFQRTAREMLPPDSSAGSNLDIPGLDIRGPDGKPARVVATGGASHAAEGVPDSRTARHLRALNLVLEGLKVARDAQARAHGVDLEELPQGYLGARYLADARARRDVEVYFQRYQAYMDAMAANGPALLDSIVRVAAVQAGLGESDRAALSKASQAGADFNLGPKAPIMRASREFITAALRLHRFLVRVDPRVRYDAALDQALFEDDAERLEAIRLAGEVQKKSELVVSIQRRSYERAKASAEKLSY